MGNQQQLAARQFGPGAAKRQRQVKSAATKEFKPLRKSLERKQKEILDVTAALQSSTCLDTPLALQGMVQHLQRLGCEAEALIYQAEEALAMEEIPVLEELVFPTPAPPSEAPLRLEPPPTPSADPLEVPSVGTAQPKGIREVVGVAPSVCEEEGDAEMRPRLLGLEPSVGSSPLSVASLLPQTSRLWEEARSMLGDAQEATISVCQGKACCKAGSAAVLQELSGIAEANAGLEVATTKCLDRCKQGPTLAVSNPGSDPLVCVSKDKPPKRERKLRNLLAF